jgi:putative peptidoglycan lipid II flippase
MYILIYGVESSITSIVVLIVLGFTINLMILMYSNRDFLIRYIRLGIDYRHDDFMSPLKKSLPIIIGYVGAITTSIVDQWFASYEQVGAISVLAYASMLFLLPMEVFGKAVMDTYFTKFSQLSNERDALLKSYHEGMNIIFFILMPISLFLLLSNTELIRVIFERGEFTSGDTLLTSLVLSALSLGLVLRAVTYFNYRLLHAIDKSWIAISVGLIGVVINIIFNFILAKYYGLVGIALATTISILSSVILSCILLKKFYNIKYYSYLNINLAKIISIALGSIFIYDYIVNRYSCESTESCFYMFHLAMLLFLPVIFILVGYLFKVKEVSSLLEYVKHRKNA